MKRSEEKRREEKRRSEGMYGNGRGSLPTLNAKTRLARLDSLERMFNLEKFSRRAESRQ